MNNINSVEDANAWIKKMIPSNIMSVRVKNYGRYGKYYELRSILTVLENVNDGILYVARSLKKNIDLNKMITISSLEDANKFIRKIDKSKSFEMCYYQDNIGAGLILVKTLTRTKDWNELLKDLNYYVSEVTR
jgi:hypothetical protein